MTGERHGRLTVRGLSHTDRRGSYWSCRCACGMDIVVWRQHLRLGHTRSCGCLAREYRASKRRDDYLSNFTLLCLRVRRALVEYAPGGVFVDELAAELDADARRIALAVQALGRAGEPVTRVGDHVSMFAERKTAA